MNVDWDPYAEPGHLLRRAQQAHKILFAEHVSSGLTSPQFAMLAGLYLSPDIDQITLTRRLAIDRSTVADVASRLEDRGLIARGKDEEDGRRNILQLTDAGKQTFLETLPEIAKVKANILEAFDPGEAEMFMRLLIKFIGANDSDFKHADGRYPTDD